MTLASYFDYDFSGNSGQSAEAASGINNTLFFVLLIIGCVLATVALVFGIINFIKNIKITKRLNSLGDSVSNSLNEAVTRDVGVVFCRKCGNQFAATGRACPFCGEKR